MNRIFFIILISSFLFSCGGLKEAGKVLKGEKIKTTDQFLIKKRNPLILPPEYEEIPEPRSLPKKVESEQDKIRKVLKSTQEEKIIKNKSSSTEESILDKIRK